MKPLFGETRSSIAWNHALIAPDSHVAGLPSAWGDVEGVTLISPAMRGPRFCQYLVRGGANGSSLGPANGVQRLLYVLQGDATVEGHALSADEFAYFPLGDTSQIEIGQHAELLIFEKPYEPLDGYAMPVHFVGSLSKAITEPFQDDPDALLATLLPSDPAFDMAVNVFTFQPGAALPLVESHVMEHGLFMKQGQGIYRLGDRWYPVQAGDTIWMASYCPQWFTAMGKEPAAYIYYKDINRDPITRIM